MSFILRFVVILFIFSFVVYVLKAIARISHKLRGTVRDVSSLRDRLEQPEKVSAEMVRCRACGAFVATRDSIQVSSGKERVIYCSNECLRTHQATA